MKMSDVFTLPVTTKLKFTGDKSNELTPDVILIDEHYVLNGTECNAVELAINSHDRMVEEIAELKGALESLHNIALLGDFGAEVYSGTLLESDVLKLINQEREE